MAKVSITRRMRDLLSWAHVFINPCDVLCRSLHPARHAAATLLRYQQAFAGQPSGRQRRRAAEEEIEESADDWLPLGAGDVQVLRVEHHSRQPQDWCVRLPA